MFIFNFVGQTQITFKWKKKIKPLTLPLSSRKSFLEKVKVPGTCRVVSDAVLRIEIVCILKFKKKAFFFKSFKKHKINFSLIPEKKFHTVMTWLKKKENFKLGAPIKFLFLVLYVWYVLV